MKNHASDVAYSATVVAQRPKTVEVQAGDCSTAALRSLLRYTLWSDLECLCYPAVNDLTSKRSIKKHDGVSSGEFFSKKLDRTVQYESSLEHEFFVMLENSRDVLWYLERPVRVRYLREREPSIYVPDVLLCLGRNRFVIVEIKPVAAMLAHSNVDKYLALRGYCNGIGWGVLITDGQFSFMQLARHKINADYAAEMRARLKEAPLYYGDYKEIEKVYGASKLDFAAVVLQQEIQFTIKPFRLARKANRQSHLLY